MGLIYLNEGDYFSFDSPVSEPHGEDGEVLQDDAEDVGDHDLWDGHGQPQPRIPVLNIGAIIFYPLFHVIH